MICSSYLHLLILGDRIKRKNKKTEVISEGMFLN